MKSPRNHNKVSLEDIRENVKVMVERHGWNHDALTRSIYLTSELGEVIKELLDFNRAPSKTKRAKAKKQLGEELFDLIWNAVALADEVGVDLDAACRDKMAKNEKRKFRPSVKVKT